MQSCSRRRFPGLGFCVTSSNASSEWFSVPGDPGSSWGWFCGQVWKAVPGQASKCTKLKPELCWAPETQPWGTFCPRFVHPQHLASGLEVPSSWSSTQISFPLSAVRAVTVRVKLPLLEGSWQSSVHCLCFHALGGLSISSGRGRARLEQGAVALGCDKSLSWAGRCLWELSLKLEVVTRCDCSDGNDPAVKNRENAVFYVGIPTFPSCEVLHHYRTFGKGKIKHICKYFQ